MILAVIGYVFAPSIVAVFRDDQEVVAVGTVALRMQCLSFPLAAWLVMCNMMSQTIGKAIRASFLAMSRQGLFFIPLVLLLPQFMGLFGVEIAQALSDVVSFAVAIPLQVGLLREMTREEQSWTK